MCGGNSDSDAYVDAHTDRHTGYVQLVRRAEFAYGFD
jgi:hypothetical protein